MCAENVKSWFKSWVSPFTFQAYILPYTFYCMCNWGRSGLCSLGMMLHGLPMQKFWSVKHLAFHNRLTFVKFWIAPKTSVSLIARFRFPTLIKGRLPWIFPIILSFDFDAISTWVISYIFFSKLMQLSQRALPNGGGAAERTF